MRFEQAAAAELRALDVQLDFGSVTVFGSPDAKSITFEGSSLCAADTKDALSKMVAQQVSLRAELTGDTLTLKTSPLPQGVDPATARQVIRGILRCPDRLKLTVRTALGHVKADSMRADVDIETALGEVAVKTCRGRVRVLSKQGDVMVDRHVGSLDLAAPAGSARAYVTELAAPGATLAAKTAAEIYLPRKAEFELTGRATGGRCHNSFGVPVSFDGNGAMSGRVGGGGPAVSLEARQGQVTCGVTD